MPEKVPPLARDEELRIVVPAYVRKVSEFMAAKQGRTPEYILRDLLHMWAVDVRLTYPRIEKQLPDLRAAISYVERHG